MDTSGLQKLIEQGENSKLDFKREWYPAFPNNYTYELN